MDKNIDNRLLQFWNEIIEVQEKTEKALYSFFKGLTTVLVGFLGLLIALKPEEIPVQEAKNLFLASIILIGCCILSSVIVQFGEVSHLREAGNVLKKKLNTFYQTKDATSLRVVRVQNNKVYMFFEYSTFVFLILSIVSLILYVYSLEFASS
tara:strand:+ start:268 stop:723 length:456 start_codon:yes stop_codon:yes gene_type:complete